jgi:hypothetical protein
MNFQNKLSIAGELRLVQALSRGAENHVGDDNLPQAIEAAEQATKHLQEALGELWAVEALDAIEKEDAVATEAPRQQAQERDAEWEVREVRRAFEKFGLSELLVSAHGTLSPQLAVTRLLTFIAQRDMDIELKASAPKPPPRK